MATRFWSSKIRPPAEYSRTTGSSWASSEANVVGPSDVRRCGIMAGVGPDGVTGSTGTAGSGEATSPDGCRPKTVAGVGCADVAGLTGAADGAETGMVTGVAAGAVRVAGGISTSRGVGIAVVCAAAALATATAASTAA